jgi:hypothetical protein
MSILPVGWQLVVGIDATICGTSPTLVFFVSLFDQGVCCLFCSCMADLWMLFPKKPFYVLLVLDLSEFSKNC